MSELVVEENEPKVKTYLGFDFSTQQVKAIVINDELKVLQEASVQFDNDLPEYRTHGGVNTQEDGLTVTAPTIMWVKALDMLMDKLRVAGTDFPSIIAISGTGQQHGSIYWRKGTSAVLSNLQPDKFLFEQLNSSFTIPDSPVWMDSSTSKYCRKLEEAIGGPQKLAEITGSRAYDRFTGNQIAKLAKEKAETFNNTERISLVSSFGCCLLAGKFAPIDYSDGSGMNLFNIRTKKWDQACLNTCAPNLSELLGDPVPSNTVVGNVAKYFVERYDLDPNCAVVAFTGDNPSSLAGMTLRKGDIAISLGTSDTLFLWLEQPQPRLEGHIFINPVQNDEYMALLCFKNGSLTREKIRDSTADGSWELFSELLDMTPRGNFGNIGMYYYWREITPELEGVFRFNKAGDSVERFASNEVEVRAVVEGQMMAKRIHGQRLGLNIKDLKRVLVTGGASTNKKLLQIVADVFNSSVYTMNVQNSAALGAAYRAKHGVSNGEPFEKVIKSVDFSLAVSPNTDAAKVYDPLIERFETLEEQLKIKFNV